MSSAAFKLIMLSDMAPLWAEAGYFGHMSFQHLWNVKSYSKIEIPTAAAKVAITKKLLPIHILAFCNSQRHMYEMPRPLQAKQDSCRSCCGCHVCRVCFILPS